MDVGGWTSRCRHPSPGIELSLSYESRVFRSCVVAAAAIFGTFGTARGTVRFPSFECPTPPSRRNRSTRDLDRAVIALPLQEQMDAQGERRLQHRHRPQLAIRAGAIRARRVRDLATMARPAAGNPAPASTIARRAQRAVRFACLSEAIRAMVRLDTQSVGGAIGSVARGVRIWPDFGVRALTIGKHGRCPTRRSRGTAAGKNVVWALLDSGQADHPHRRHWTLSSTPLATAFTAPPGTRKPAGGRIGHGTHVAGIIAGELVRRTAIRFEARHTAVISAIRDTATSRARSSRSDADHQFEHRAGVQDRRIKVLNATERAGEQSHRAEIMRVVATEKICAFTA